MPGDFQDRLTNSLRKLRFEHGELTQQELADRAGVTRQTIIALEAGKYVPSLLLAFRLAAAFGVRIDEVFHYDQR
jgi:putative transcriptional regulator